MSFSSPARPRPDQGRCQCEGRRAGTPTGGRCWSGARSGPDGHRVVPHLAGGPGHTGAPAHPGRLPPGCRPSARRPWRPPGRQGDPGRHRSSVRRYPPGALAGDRRPPAPDRLGVLRRRAACRADRCCPDPAGAGRSAPPPEVVPLSATEARAVLEVARGRRNATRWSVALALGLCQGEALGLCWADDLGAGRLTVSHQLQWRPWSHGCAEGTGLRLDQLGVRRLPEAGSAPPRHARRPRQHRAARPAGPPSWQRISRSGPASRAERAGTWCSAPRTAAPSAARPTWPSGTGS